LTARFFSSTRTYLIPNLKPDSQRDQVGIDSGFRSTCFEFRLFLAAFTGKAFLEHLASLQSAAVVNFPHG
jgi:hypothetical protein